MNSRISASILALASLCLLGTPAGAQERELYRYTNDQGILVMDDHIPAKYVAGGYEVLGADGMVKRVVPRALTEAERQSIAEQDRREQLAKAEQERLREWDESLMLRYSSLTDIEAARDRALRELQIRVSILRSNTRSLKQQVENYQSKAADLERVGSTIPVELLSSIDDLQGDIASTERSIADRQEEMKAVEESFERDMARFELLLDRVELRREYSRLDN